MKKYFEPTISISKFCTENIITTSGTSGNNSLTGTSVDNIPEGAAAQTVSYNSFKFTL